MVWNCGIVNISCIVHQVRNTLKHKNCKQRYEEFAQDLKTIYRAESEKKAKEHLDTVTAKWQERYPNPMKRWHDNWDVIRPIFKFSKEVRKVIYTTNAIESLKTLMYLQEIKCSKKRISKRYSPTQISLPLHSSGYQKMEHAT